MIECCVLLSGGIIVLAIYLGSIASPSYRPPPRPKTREMCRRASATARKEYKSLWDALADD